MPQDRTDKAYVRAVARSLYWGFSREATGKPARLSEQDDPTQQFWIRMARRAIRRIEELDTEAEPQKS